MLPEKHWSLESLLRFILGVLICFCLGPLFGFLMTSAGFFGTESDREFYGTLIGNLSLQGAILVLTPFFLKEAALTWNSAFGISSRKTYAILVGIGTGMIMLVVAMGMLWFLNLLVKSFSYEPVLQPVVEIVQSEKIPGRKVYFGVMTILLAPVAEEILFRGILYPTIKHHGYPRAAFWGVAILFGLSHYNMLTFLPLTFLGLALAALYEKTNNLLAPIVAHSFFNAVNFAWLVFPEPMERFWEILFRPLTHLLELFK